MRLFDLPIHHASRWIFNCYVIEDGGAGTALVVDAGLPLTAALASAVLAQVTEVAPTIVATHGHSDHVAGIPQLLAAHGGQVHLPQRCEAFLAGERARTPGPRQVAKILPLFADQPFDARALAQFAGSSDVGYGRGDRMVVPFGVDGFLRDGVPFTAAPAWAIFHTPGHSDDSTCLYHAASATLVSGDAVLTYDGRAWFNPEVVDPVLSRRTEERLRELDVRHLLPGHGRPLHGLDLLGKARSFTTAAEGRGLLTRLSRGLGAW
jgi:glyoxylase-like metal-dependent hydrolase (beta-lactamase superfamily II)